MRVEGRVPSMNRRQRRAQRGVALIVVVAVLAFLTAIAVTFFTMTRIELHNASSKRDAMLAEYQSQGALAIAMAFLNHDLDVHPTATSLDHAWRTYFNGAWFVGKEWMFDSVPPTAITSLTDGDVVTGKFIPRILQGYLNPITYDQLYIPRFQGNDPAVDPPLFGAPFVIPQNYDGLTSRAAVVDLWADVDLDGDGFKDAVWLPMPMERPLDNDGIDNDLDGWIDEGPDMATDGIDNDGLNGVDDPGEDLAIDGVDNDGDGLVDEGPGADTDGIDNDGDGDIDEGDGSERGDPSSYEVVTFEGELGLFVYWGGNDGLDNDGRNGIDDPIEQRVFLTTQLFYDSDLTNSVPDQTSLPSFSVRYDEGRLTEFAQLASPPLASALTLDTIGNVDVLDNDYSLVTNEVGYYTYPLPAWYPYGNWVHENFWARDLTPDRRQELADRRRPAYNDMNVEAYWPGLFDPQVRITAAGEPVCDLAGRFAVLITDEASKVDLNATGAYTRDDLWGWDGELWNWPNPEGPAIKRASAAGSSPLEYELRVVDGADTATSIGLAKANHLWSLRNGAYNGIGLASHVTPPPVPPSRLDPDSPLNLDVGLPGYGWTDDNGNALWLTMNGVDDDGDGLIDEGLNPRYPELLGQTFEGIDEPAELQLHRPLRNMVMETNDFDDDSDGALDELGELGDRLFRTFDQLDLVDGIAGDTVADLGGRLTVHNAGPNDRYRYFDVFGAELFEDIDLDGVRDPGENPRPEVSGLKLDYNYATADQISRYLREECGYVESYPGGVGGDALLFAAGLRQSSVSIDGGANILGGAAATFRRDGALHADQLAVNVKDGGDSDYARTQVTTTVVDDWWVGAAGGPADKAISYTASGVEGIRINEIMARAVRRVEAEATTNSADAGYSAVNAYDAAFDPNDFSLFPGAVATQDFDMRVRTMLTGMAEYNAANGTAWGPVGLPPVDWDTVDSGYIGDTAYVRLSAAEPTGEFLIDDPVIGAPHLVPHLVEFRFKPSPGLPPGRYYLTVNTSTAGYAVGTTMAGGDTDQIRWVAKIDTAATSIIDDAISMAADFAVPVDPDYVPYRNPEIGLYSMHNGAIDPAFDGPTGWSLLHAPPAEPGYPAPRDGYWAGSAATEAVTYTVVVPEYNVDPALQEYLYVAVWRGADDIADEIAINFFDFSQEPDHEWVEIVNVNETGDPVNLSDWHLTVGTTGDDRLQMRIPEDTYIAPGGSLLLGVNKFDELDNAALRNNPSWPNLASLICDNGIGLARGEVERSGTNYDFTRVTAPPIPDMEFARYLTLTGTALDLGESVFWRTDSALTSFFFTDFVDYDGNGVLDADVEDLQPPSTHDPYGPNPPDKAWDRIVELQINELRIVTALPGPSGLAAWILKGGIFPNYPEHDTIDNDDDNAVLQVDEIDSDGDGDVDEIEDVPTLDMGEGVDEGRREWWTGAPDFGQPGAPVPGSFSGEFVQHTFPGGTEDASTMTYLGDAGEPARWKEFLERRMYPGDNVVVTLLDDDGAVVDRVTYTERDVINRSIDDKITVAAGIPPLDPAHSTFWPDNTMAVDFYRSLERKHPLYSGDRFGTKNRWEATDGNYDDWDSGQDKWVDNGNEWLTGAELLFGHTFSGTPLRMNHFERYANNPDLLMAGSYPVQLVNPLASQGWRFERARVPNRSYTSPGSVPALPRMTLELELDAPGNDPFEIETMTRALLATGPLSPVVEQGDFHALVSGGAMHPVVLSCGQADFYPLAPTHAEARGNNALVEWNTTLTQPPVAWSPVFLYPLTAVGGDEDPGVTRQIGFFEAPFPVGAYPAFSHLAPDWYDGGAWPTALAAYPIQMNFLFNAPLLPPGIVLDDLRQRWPLDARAVAYMCANPATFDVNVYDQRHRVLPVANVADLASEALFVWDGTAGLEDGEYDVYVVTADPLDALYDADEATADTLLTTFGTDFRGVSDGPAPDELAMDLEFFTDSGFRDRRCWSDGANVDGSYDYPGAGPVVDGLPQPDELNTVDDGDPTTPVCVESLGLVMAATPDTSGVIHYGTVKVDNNYLALRIRNWAAQGRLNRFSRVVLTPGSRTSGRINVNTAETMKFRPDDGDYRYFFNPLQGLPGVLGAWSASDPDRLEQAFAEANPITNESNTDDDSVNDMWGEAEDFADYYFDARDNRAADVGMVNDIMMAREEEYEHEDGRYYRYVSDLYYGQVAAPGRQILSPSAELGPDWGSFTAEEQEQILFDENATRFSALANVATTRSDVFTITVMAQAGYAVDEDGDGMANWRDDNEFKVNAENRLRTVYER